MPLVVRATALWGTYVVMVRAAPAGRSVHVGTGRGALPRPEGCTAPQVLIAAKVAGWELDPAGATGGKLHLSGVRHDVSALGGVKAQLGAGDYGLVEYGSYAVLFQVTHAAPLLERARRLDGELGFGFLVAVMLVGGGLAFARSLSNWDTPKPNSLTSSSELAQRFHVHAAPSASALAVAPTAAQPEADSTEAEPGELALAVSEIGRAGPGPRASAQPDAPPAASARVKNAPPLSVEPEGPHQGLGVAALYRVFAPRLPALYGCYALAAPETTQDDLAASIAVEPNGRINERVDVHSQTGNGLLERCVARKIERFEFGSASKPTQARVRIAYGHR